MLARIFLFARPLVARAVGYAPRIATVLAALALVAGTEGAGTEGADTAGAASDEGATFALREVVDGHFVHVGRHVEFSAANGGDIATIGFVVGTRSVAVIDPGGSIALGRALEAALRARTTLPVSHVVLTHFHPDHVFGASVFAKPGVAIVAHANYARSRVQRGAFYAERFAALLDGQGEAALVAPTLEVMPGSPLTIDLGKRRLELVAHPTAHTDNDLSVLDAASGTLWAGDLVFERRTPALDGSLPGWLATMDTRAATAPRLVVPGHGMPGPPGSMLDAQRRYLETLLGDTRRALADGASLADTLAVAERARDDTWALFALQHPTNVTRAWTELEWE